MAVKIAGTEYWKALHSGEKITYDDIVKLISESPDEMIRDGGQYTVRTVNGDELNYPLFDFVAPPGWETVFEPASTIEVMRYIKYAN